MGKEPVADSRRANSAQPRRDRPSVPRGTEPSIHAHPIPIVGCLSGQTARLRRAFIAHGFLPAPPKPVASERMGPAGFLGASKVRMFRSNQASRYASQSDSGILRSNEMGAQHRASRFARQCGAWLLGRWKPLQLGVLRGATNFSDLWPKFSACLPLALNLPFLT
jgi:hypothetical protein